MRQRVLTSLWMLAIVGPAIAQDAYNPLEDCKVTIIDEVLVPAPEAGVIDEMLVTEGQLVEKGQALALIDKSDVELAVQIAQFEYESAFKQANNLLSIKAAQKSHKVAVAEHESSIVANNRSPGTVTETDLRRKLLQAERAEMQIELAAHEVAVAVLDARAKAKSLDRAKAALERREIKSPINGIVVRLDKHTGDWANPGETLMRVVRMDQLRVEGDVNGAIHARHDIINRPVSIAIKLTGGKTFNTEGTIKYAGSIVERNEYTIRVTVNNQKVNGVWLLTPGLDAEVKLNGAAPAFGRLGNLR